MADSFDQFENLLREWISPSVVNLVFEDDDPAWNVMGTFDPLTEGGRRTDANQTAGYEASYRVKVQGGARVSGGVFTGNTTEMLGGDTHLATGQTADAKYLDPELTPLPSWIAVKVLLQRIRGSVTINRQQIIAELATRPIDEVAGDAVVDSVRRLRSYILNYFYGDGTGALATIATTISGVGAPNTAGGVEVTLNDGPFTRFNLGDLVTVASGTWPAMTVKTPNLRVVNMDPDNRTIYLESTSNMNVELTAGDSIFLEGTATLGGTSVSLVPEGIESLLIKTGLFPGTQFAVDDHGVLKSFVVDNSTSTSSAVDDPTMDAIALLVDKIRDFGRQPPSIVIGEKSMWTLHAQIEREGAAHVMVPMGQSFHASAGVSGVSLDHMGNRFARMESTRIRPNAIVGLAPDTWMKYIPLGDRTVNWVYGNGPFAGVNSVFGPVYSGTQLTELADAPFDSFCEFGCKEPNRNFRRIGFKTQRDV